MHAGAFAGIAAALTFGAPAAADTGFRASHAQAGPHAGSIPVAAAGAKVSLRRSRRFVFLGQRVRLHGRLTRNGHPLAGRVVRLRADPYPFGNGFRTVSQGRTLSDGRYWFLGPPKRNTRYRVTVPAAGISSRRVLVYADYSGVERHSWRSGRLRMGFTIFAPFDTPGPGGRKIHFYLTQNGASTMPLVASTRMRRLKGGYLRGRAVASTRRPQSGEHVWVCWREETSDGFGLPNPLDKVCGDDSVTTPPPP